MNNCHYARSPRQKKPNLKESFRRQGEGGEVIFIPKTERHKSQWDLSGPERSGDGGRGEGHGFTVLEKNLYEGVRLLRALGGPLTV